MPRGQPASNSGGGAVPAASATLRRREITVMEDERRCPAQEEALGGGLEQFSRLRSHILMLTPARLTRRAALTTMLLLAGCHIPTEAPIVVSNWIVPAATEELPVADLLPSGDLQPDGDAFAVTDEPVVLTQSLTALCPQCRDLDGQTVPVPDVDARLAQSIPLPTDMSSLTLAPGGTFDVTLVNTLGLDLLRPAPGRTGELILTLRGGGALLASDTLRGSNRALPHGGQLTVGLALPAGARLSGPVDLQLDLHLPTGGFVTIDRAAGLAVTVTPRDLGATTVVMRVLEAPVRAAPTALSFADVPAGLRSALQRAVLELNVEGADAFTGSFTLSFRSESGVPILRPIQVPLATPTTSVTFGPDAVQALVSHPVVMLELEGMMRSRAADGLVQVAPAQIIRITPRVILTTQLDF